MSQITTPPKGLISLFGLRDMGAVPADLAEQVVATIDITEFALTNRESLNLGNATANLVANWALGTQATVPAGEMWYVHSFSLLTDTLGAGEAIEIKPVVYDSALIFGRGARASGTAGHAIMAFTDRMFLATPGQSLQVLVESITGTVQISGFALITRLRI